MLGSNRPNYDACGLFRALHSHNPTQYSHIVGLVVDQFILTIPAVKLSDFFTNHL